MVSLVQIGALLLAFLPRDAGASVLLKSSEEVTAGINALNSLLKNSETVTIDGCSASASGGEAASKRMLPNLGLAAKGYSVVSDSEKESVFNLFYVNSCNSDASVSGMAFWKPYGVTVAEPVGLSVNRVVEASTSLEQFASEQSGWASTGAQADFSGFGQSASAVFSATSSQSAAMDMFSAKAEMVSRTDIIYTLLSYDISETQALLDVDFVSKLVEFAEAAGTAAASSQQLFDGSGVQCLPEMAMPSWYGEAVEKLFAKFGEAFPIEVELGGKATLMTSLITSSSSSSEELKACHQEASTASASATYAGTSAKASFDTASDTCSSSSDLTQSSGSVFKTVMNAMGGKDGGIWESEAAALASRPPDAGPPSDEQLLALQKAFLGWVASLSITPEVVHRPHWGWLPDLVREDAHYYSELPGSTGQVRRLSDHIDVSWVRGLLKDALQCHLEHRGSSFQKELEAFAPPQDKVCQYHRIISKSNGSKCMTAGQYLGMSTQVYAATCLESDSQFWDLQAVDDRRFLIKNKVFPDMCLDVSKHGRSKCRPWDNMYEKDSDDDDDDDGDNETVDCYPNLYMYPCHGQDNQLFVDEMVVSTGSYFIAGYKGLVLDQSTNSGNLFMNNRHSGANQQFDITCAQWTTA